MAQVMKGNPSLKQTLPTTHVMPSGRAAASNGGLVVMSKATAHTISTATTLPGLPQPVAAAMMPAQLPPGMIAVNQATTAPVNGNSTSPQPLTHLANTKEKTPMCLINELARFNKIQHQYTLTDEQGPAHKKTFFVKLKLGDEEYAASGPSIKKAQHAAASNALEKTQYKHPPPKPPKACTDGNSITPTVELNALAMKRGEPAIYHPLEIQHRQPPPPAQFYPPPPNMDFRGMYNQRYHYPRSPNIFYVSLKVGQREFIGEGRTRQSARHNAAEKALKVLRNLPLPANCSDKKEEVDEVIPVVPEIEEEESGLDQKDALKSEISLVHEIALKRNMPVYFEVTRESGPPHMRTFITRCVCGELLAEADGNSKKISKKRAAEKMIDQLRALPGLPSPTIAKPKKNPGNKKKNRNLIKVEKATPDYGVGINPISRLIQIQQAKKEKEPVYTLYAERGLPRRREFVMQVAVGEHVCTGVGPNKKLAKRNAAEAMLQVLGYSRPAPQPTKPAIKSEQSPAATDKKVTFMDPHSTQTSRQLVPGVILMPEAQRNQVSSVYLAPSSPRSSSPPTTSIRNTLHDVKFSPQTTAAIAKELLDTGVSATAESIIKSGATVAASQSVVSPKKQLLYLADVLGFQVQFTDFPKGNNKSEYLSLVSLSTTPPQVSHGAGLTIDDSHDIAAITALKALSELGLDSVVAAEVGASGDGPRIKEEPKLANCGADAEAN